MASNRYDGIIIGAGIGGLVCANYLARAGKKILVLEKNNFAGGCCSSFIKDGFLFDSGPKIFMALNKTGYFRRILSELGVFKSSDYVKFSPTAIFYTPGREYRLEGNCNQILRYLRLHFPDEDIRRFFSLLNKKNSYLYAYLKNETFQDVLDRYFDSPEIKFIFSSLVFPLAVHLKRMSAVHALKFLKLLFTQGIFYPKNGIQAISDRLVENLVRHGGKITFNFPVNKILIKGNKAYGVRNAQRDIFYADFIVSNISPIATVRQLARDLKITAIQKKRMEAMDLSESAFVVNVALKEGSKFFAEKTMYLCFFKQDYRRKMFLSREKLYNSWGVICVPISILAGRKESRQRYSLNLMTVIGHKPKCFWDKYKEEIADKMINDLEVVAPGFKSNVLFRNVATPYTFERYTGNDNGALGGWAMTPEQSGFDRFPYCPETTNMYFAGHWVYPGIGISGVAISGRAVAKLILG